MRAASGTKPADRASDPPASASPTAASIDAYPTRTQARLETRARVLEAALAEFRRVGAGAAQVEDIVRAAGVARGTFYLHFPTKDHVLMEVLLRLQTGVAHDLEAALDQPPSVFFERAADLLADAATGEDASVVPDVLAMLARNSQVLEGADVALTAAVTRFISGAQARGEIRADAPPAEMAFIFLAGVFGVLIVRVRAGREELRAALRRANAVLVRGFSAS